MMRKESHVHYVKILITKYKDNVRNASWLGRLIGITFSLLRSSPLDAMYILDQQPDGNYDREEDVGTDGPTGNDPQDGVAIPLDDENPAWQDMPENEVFVHAIHQISRSPYVSFHDLYSTF